MWWPCCQSQAKLRFTYGEVALELGSNIQTKRDSPRTILTVPSRTAETVPLSNSEQMNNLTATRSINKRMESKDLWTVSIERNTKKKQKIRNVPLKQGFDRLNNWNRVGFLNFYAEIYLRFTRPFVLNLDSRWG